jgi:diguanylate cyclase (GGDEF)-like protein/PAS domain S-box-containing protein
MLRAVEWLQLMGEYQQFAPDKYVLPDSVLNARYQYFVLFLWCLLLYALCCLALMQAESASHLHLHLMLDSANSLIPWLLALFLLDTPYKPKPGIKTYLAIGFLLTAGVELIHALAGIEWRDGLIWIAQYSGPLRSASWQVSAYLLPISLAASLGVVSYGKTPSRTHYSLALATAAAGLYALAFYPPAMPDMALLETKQLSQLALLLLWLGVIAVYWRKREAHPLAEGVALMGVLLFLSQVCLLYSPAPHEKFGSMAHVGKLLAYLFFYLVQIRVSAAENRARGTADSHLSLLIATSSTLLFSMRVVGEQLQTHWVSDNLDRLLGYTKEEVMRPDWWMKHLNPKDRGRVLAASARLFQGEPVVCDYRFMHKNGHEVWIHDEQKLVCDAQGRPIEVVSSWSDITGQKMAELELRIAAITFESHEGILVTDANKTIQRVNHAFTQVTGYSAEEVIGKTPAILKSGRQDADFYDNMWQTIQQEDFWQGEIWNRRKNGEIYPEWLIITAIKDSQGQISNYVATFSDITERKEAEECIRNLAFYDPLTKLPNRRLLQDRLNQALATSQRNRRHGAIMFLDLDRFKLLNDTYGHSMGDQLLLAVAERLQGCVRASDTVARLGGDEFVVLLGSLDEYTSEAVAQARKVAEKIRTALAKPYHLPTHDGGGTDSVGQQSITYHSSTSIGVVMFLGHTHSVEELMKRADLTMYEAKHAGRDAICVFDPAMQLALNARAALEEHMREALDQQYQLYYQMQVDQQGRPVGAEALIRWQHPERGLLLPLEFIPLAEESGLIVPIGKWVLQTACAQLKAWESEPRMRHLKLAVNISPYQFRQADFVEHVSAALQTSGANAARLELEITESLILYDIDDTIAKMWRLKDLGVSFAMDDFGTGYSSLSNLQRLPLDQLKIDQSFIRDMASDANDAAIVKAILTMGKNLGIDVVAEGVENAAQHDFLLQHGCPTCQGYLFSEPLPLEDFEAAMAGKLA